MIRFAVIGTNFITDRFLSVIPEVPELEFYAVYSRTLERAREYAAKYEVSVCYDSLEQLAADPAIDAVYIASPNYCHCSQAVMLLQAGKHVLVEKPAASNYHEFEQMTAAAEHGGAVLMEGMRSVFGPGYQFAKQHLADIGPVRQVVFQFCQYSSRYDNFKNGIIENAFKPEYSNGALMDIGVYCVHPLVKMFGMPKTVNADAILLSNGIDGAGTIQAVYEGMQAQLIYSKITKSTVPSQIIGEKGTIFIDKMSEFNHVWMELNNGEKCEYREDTERSNMYYEAAEFVQLILANKEAAVWHDSDVTANQMKLMDEARRQMGIIFPAD